jgi:hypothetical protein
MKDRRHFYLYAKHWYRRSDDLMADLHKIHASVMLYGPVHDDCLVEYLVNLVAKYIIKSEYRFTNFVNDIHPLNSWKIGSPPEHGPFSPSKELHNVRVARKCLSVMRTLSVDEIGFELGEPDPSVLPLKPVAED